MKKNETLGAIVRFLIDLHDQQFLTDTILNCLLADYSLTMSTLQQNKAFIEGVFSGFEWSPGIEGFFTRKLLTYKSVEVVGLSSIGNTISEFTPTIEQEAALDKQAEAFALGQESVEVVPT